ncbi:MAG: hypothetical protein ABFS17_12595 [Chloroflexota bacterium]
MGFKRLPKYRKNIWIVTLLGAAAYLVLNLVFLDVQIGEQLYGLIYGVVEGRGDLVPEDSIAILFDGVICIGGLLFWVFFFGQFVLPTHTLRERTSTPPLIFKLLTGGEKGPAIFIRDGKKVERLEESERKGAGMILLDSASAAVLTKKGKFSRAVGPGLVFTRKNEIIAHTVDLRTQVREIGPAPDDRFFFKTGETDPLAELPNSRREREARRMQTSGLTRDGIEVIPTITVIFKLDAEAGEGKSQFGYREESVKKAVWHQAIVPGDAPGTRQTVAWEWLPAHLAADLWREYLRKYKLNQLFNITEAESSGGTGSRFDQTAFKRITETITARLSEPYVEMMDDVGQPTRQREKSHEYELLKDHGIQVISVQINELHLKDEDTLIKRWDATWLQQAAVQASNTSKRHQLRVRKGEEQAAKEFAISAVGQLYRDLTAPTPTRPGPAATLRRLLRSTQSSVVRNTMMLEELSEERAHLDDILKWLSNTKHGADE